MSHFHRTLNFVSKAVFGNPNEMTLCVAQLKPSSWILRKVSDSGWLKQKHIKQTIKSENKEYNAKSVEKNFPEKRNYGI